MNDVSDEELWQRLLAGDEGAYGTIWDRHRDRVFRHLLGAGEHAADAEDLTAIVFLELWRRRDAIRFVDGAALPWLLVTARNVHRNSSRARARHRAFLARLPPPDPVPDHAATAAEGDSPAVARLREIIRAARPADARLLAMTALEGFSIREAAEAVGLRESAAKMRLQRLRRRLRIDLEPLIDREGEA